MREKKNIGVVMIIGQFHPIIGGAERASQNLSKSLIEKGIKVTVLTHRQKTLSEFEVVDGIPVYRKIKGWHPWGFTYMLSVLSFLLKHRNDFDIIQCYGLFLFIPPAILMKYIFGKRVICRFLCSGPYGDFQGITQLKLKRLILVCAKYVDRIIVISEDIKKELMRNGFPNEKLLYIANGVDSNRFTPAKTHTYLGAKNICFVGRLEKQKGVVYLIKAMGIISAKVHEVVLFIVGNGWLRTFLEELSQSMKLGNHIIFVGEKDDALPYYQQSDILILPSESEGMSNVLLEAMACGLSVVVSDVGGNAELMGEKIEEKIDSKGTRYFVCAHGMLVPPGDVNVLAEATLRLLEDSALSKKMGTSARKTIEKYYSHSEMVDRYISLYEII